MIAKHIDAVVSFYVEQSDADNHAVREASCTCIAELAMKIDKDALVCVYTCVFCVCVCVCTRVFACGWVGGCMSV